MDEIGSKRPILVLSYHNCELYCCHLDGYHSHRDALLRRLTEIEAELSAKPVQARFRIWYNMDGNQLDTSVMEFIAASIGRIQGRIHKIVFIGLQGVVRWRFNRILVRTLGNTSIPKAYFSDAEEAKGWLI